MPTVDQQNNTAQWLPRRQISLNHGGELRLVRFLLTLAYPYPGTSTKESTIKIIEIQCLRFTWHTRSACHGFALNQFIDQ